jgi:hypothetical protein
MRSGKRHHSIALNLAAMIVLLIAGCGDDKNDKVVPQTDGQSTGTQEQTTDTASSAPTDDPEFQKKLKVAREAKEREAKDPDSMTACLKADGTLAGVVSHTRKEGAPHLTKADKERDCGYAAKNASGGPVPPPGQE